MCERHGAIHRQEALKRGRARGSKPWIPGGKGCPPLRVRAVANGDTDIIICESMIADALAERATLTKRIARLRTELTKAKREAVLRAEGWKPQYVSKLAETA